MSESQIEDELTASQASTAVFSVFPAEAAARPSLEVAPPALLPVRYDDGHGYQHDGTEEQGLEIIQTQGEEEEKRDGSTILSQDDPAYSEALSVSIGDSFLAAGDNITFSPRDLVEDDTSETAAESGTTVGTGPVTASEVTSQSPRHQVITANDEGEFAVHDQVAMSDAGVPLPDAQGQVTGQGGLGEGSMEVEPTATDLQK